MLEGLFFTPSCTANMGDCGLVSSKLGYTQGALRVLHTYNPSCSFFLISFDTTLCWHAECTSLLGAFYSVCLRKTGFSVLLFKNAL